MNQGELYFRNYFEESAEIIGVLFPDYFYHKDPNDPTFNNEESAEDLELMFSVARETYLDSALKISLEMIDIGKLIKYVAHMGSSTINCVAYCYELNQSICDVLKCIAKSNITIRLLYVISHDVNILGQTKFVKIVDKFYQGSNNKIKIKFKKIHTDSNIVKQLDKITLKNIRTQIKIDFNDINEKILSQIFNGGESKIKYSLLLNVESKRHKKNITIPQLNNVKYIGFYQKNNKSNKINKIKISFPIKHVSLMAYCKPIEITAEHIKKLKLLNCHGKGFLLNCTSEKNCITELVVKHTEYVQLFNIMKNIIVNARHLIIKNISISKNYQQIVDIYKEKITDQFKNDPSNSNKLLNMSQYWKNALNLNQIGKLETITFKNFPTLIFLTSMLLFSKDVTTVNFVNQYAYMVYEKTVSDKILYAYAAFNENVANAHYISHHYYDLVKLKVYQKKFDDEDLKMKQNVPFDTITKFNMCEEEENIKYYCKGLFTNIIQSFLLNRNS